MAGKHFEIASQSSKSKGRAGTINVNNKCIETPACLLYTSRGTPIHLSHDNLERLYKDLEAELALRGGANGVNFGALLPLNNMDEVFSNSGLWTAADFSIHRFFNLKSELLFLDQTDPRFVFPDGQSEEKHVCLISANGKYRFTEDTYMDFVARSGVDIAMTPWDPISACHSDKKLRKSVDRTNAMLSNIASKIKTSSQSAIYATIAGGASISYRTIAAEAILKLEDQHGPLFSGFNLTGLFTGEPYPRTLEILHHLSQILPENRPKTVFGSGGRPEQILPLIALGVDVFDCVHPFELSDKGIAIGLCPEYHLYFKDDLSALAKTYPAELDLWDPSFAAEKSPLSKHCTCYTCRTYSKAYINHLLITKEMLSQVALTIHNTHNYQLFFANVRLALKHGQFEDFSARFMSAYASF